MNAATTISPNMDFKFDTCPTCDTGERVQVWNHKGEYLCRRHREAIRIEERKAAIAAEREGKTFKRVRCPRCNGSGRGQYTRSGREAYCGGCSGQRTVEVEVK